MCVCVCVCVRASVCVKGEEGGRERERVNWCFTPSQRESEGGGENGENFSWPKNCYPGPQG